jgi:hypothetical protein
MGLAEQFRIEYEKALAVLLVRLQAGDAEAWGMDWFRLKSLLIAQQAWLTMEEQRQGAH